MTTDDEELSIRSRYGILRDLAPIYSLYQLVPNLLALGLIIWMSFSQGHFSARLLPIVMLGWVSQFISRPSEMIISKAQAEWLEEMLDEQGFYDRSEDDGRWRLLDKEWWQHLPHLFIELAPGDTVTVIAPRDAMESIRANLELREGHENLFPRDDQAFAFQPAEPEPVPRHMHVPAAILGTACVAAWIWYVVTHGSGGMLDWGVSGDALARGRFGTIFLHMFAHGSAMHLAMNMAMLAAIGATLTARLGPAPFSWLRFLLLYLFSGLAGAALYLALHPMGTVPMLGASGALYGLLGLLIRGPADGTDMLPVKSRQIRRVSWDLIKQNAFLFALLTVIAWSHGTAGGLAWEAHLGGFLFGLLVGPKLLPRTARVADAAPAQEGISETLAPTD